MPCFKMKMGGEGEFSCKLNELYVLCDRSHTLTQGGVIEFSRKLHAYSLKIQFLHDENWKK